MKKMLVAVVVLILTTATVSAQDDKPKPQPVTGRAAVVNVGLVLSKCDKVITKNNLVTLMKELQGAIKTVASEDAIDIVFGYGDPVAKGDLERFPNVHRKMTAMDTGGTVPLVIAPKADISQAVIDVLNKKQRKKTKLGTDRVAVLNIGQVFNGYKRAMKLKAELEDDLQPFKQEAGKLRGNIAAWEKAIRDGSVEDGSNGRYLAKIAEAKQRLGEMGAEIIAKLGKKQEDNLVTLWKDVQEGAKTYATRQGIDLLFEYGEPQDKELLDQFPNVNRKMQALDFANAMPLVVSMKRDFSDGVVQLLNSPKDVPEVKDRLGPARVHVVDMADVLDKYKRAHRLKKQIADAVAPLHDKEAKITKDIQRWETAIKAGDFADATKDEYERSITAARRQLEELTVEIERTAGAKQEQNLITLWKEIHMANDAVAKAYGMDIVFGYGEATDKKAVNAFANVNRKMQAIDLGGMVPLYVSPRSELGAIVTTTLNKWVDPEK